MRNTPNYNLPQYEGTDKFTKEVLNDAFSKVDTAINDLQETFNSGSVTGELTTQEVINARNGKESLKERIDYIKEETKERTNEIVVNVCDYINEIDDEDKDNWSLAVKKAEEFGNVIFFPKGARYIINGYAPVKKCKGEGSVLIIDGYEITLSDIPFNVNSKWQTYIRMNNTFIGLDSGKNTDSVNGYANVGIGHQALKNNVSTVRNTAIGNNSQMSLTDGYGNTSVGVDSLHCGKYSDRNTIIGATAGKNLGGVSPNVDNGLFNGVVNTFDNYDNYWSGWRTYAGGVKECLHIPTNADETTSNVGVGRNALGFSQKPTRNVAVGYNALEGGISPDNVVAVGESCLQFGVKSTNSVFVGGRCGYHNMDNDQDVVVGKSAMENTVHSTKNVALGYQALLGTQSPKDSVVTSNIAIGRLSMANYQGSIGYNVGIGEQSLSAVKNTTGTEGNGNVGLGYGTLNKVTTGAYNTALGHNAGNRSGTETHTNTTAIGYNAFCSESNQIALGNNSVTKVFSYGDFETLGAGKGFILKSPNRTKFRIKVSDSGVLSTETVT